MVMEMEFGGIDVDIQWDAMSNLEGVAAASSPFNSIDVGPHEANVPNEAEGPVDATTNQAQTIGPKSGPTEHATPITGEIPEVPRPVVDDLDPPSQILLLESSAPLLNETQPGSPSPSMAVLISEAAVSSIQNPDMTSMSRSIELSQLENGNFPMLQGLDMPNEYNTSNQLVVPNMNANDDFGGINHRSSFNPTLVQQQRAGTGTGIGTGIPNEQFMINQRTELAPLQNPILNPNRVLNSSWPQSSQFSAPNAYGSQYTPNDPPPFSTPLDQVSHATGMQSQHSTSPAYPTFARAEPYSHLQSTFVPTPPNFYDHQHAYRPKLPEPIVPSRYPPLFGSVRLSGSLQGQDKRNEYNQLLNTLNLQRHSFSLHGTSYLSSRFTTSQALSSRVLGLSGIRTAAVASSLLSSMAYETSGLSRAPGIQLQEVAPMPASRVTADRDKGKLPEPSSIRAQLSEAALKILNPSPKPTVTFSDPYPTLQQNQSVNLQIGMRQLEPSCRSRPSKRQEAGESSSSKRPKIGSSGTENTQEADNATENEGKEDQNAIATNTSSDPTHRQVSNAIFDPSFESMGVPIDPHLRLFKAQPEK